MFKIILKKWRSLQRNCCDWLQPKVNQLNRKWTIIYLVMFLLLGTISSFYILFNSFSNQSAHLPIQSISVPKNIGQSGQHTPIRSVNTDRIKNYRQQLDSIQALDSVAFREILRTRKGLIDTLQLLETLH